MTKIWTVRWSSRIHGFIKRNVKWSFKILILYVEEIKYNGCLNFKLDFLYFEIKTCVGKVFIRNIFFKWQICNQKICVWWTANQLVSAMLVTLIVTLRFWVEVSGAYVTFTFVITLINFTEVEGSRGRGRGRKAWQECVIDDMRKLGVRREAGSDNVEGCYFREIYDQHKREQQN